MKKLCATVITGCLIMVGAAVSAQSIDACDLEAGHPSDPQHVGPGKSSRQVVTQLAIPACRDALEREPDNARFHYQLGRAIVYWADANGANYDEGMQHLVVAAEQGYTQALFVLGLMHQRHSDLCAAEPMYKQAAEQGLKAARIAYVHETLAGNFASCSVKTSPEHMAGYLNAAGEQVSGYYEKMLLAALKRELTQRGDER